ncbi:UNVERIFIED_CONTAM: hypothetical protein NCL1_35139 [Trichonephila clavipes]
MKCLYVFIKFTFVALNCNTESNYCFRSKSEQGKSNNMSRNCAVYHKVVLAKNGTPLFRHSRVHTRLARAINS